MSIAAAARAAAANLERQYGAATPNAGDHRDGPSSSDVLEANKQLKGEINRLQALLIAASPIPGISMQRLKELEILKESGEPIEADARDLKILDLAKRNRQLNLALQAAKDQLQRKTLEVAAAAVEAERAHQAAPVIDSDLEALQREHAAEVKRLQSHHATLQAAVEKAQREQDGLLKELQATQRVLQREVAPESSIDDVLVLTGLKAPPLAPRPPTTTTAANTIAKGSGGDGRRGTTRDASNEPVPDAGKKRSRSLTTVASSSRTSSASARVLGVLSRAPSNSSITASGSGRPGSGSETSGGSSSSSSSNNNSAEPGSKQPSSSLSSSTSAVRTSCGWKGRGQQIVMLQAKVRALEKELDSVRSQPPSRTVLVDARSEDHSSNDAGGAADPELDGSTRSAVRQALRPEPTTTAAAAGGSRRSTQQAVPSAEDRANNEIASIKDSRIRRARELEEAVTSLSEQLKDSQQRSAAGKARIQVSTNT